MDSKWTKITYSTIKRWSLYSEENGTDKNGLKYHYIIIIIITITIICININYCVK